MLNTDLILLIQKNQINKQKSINISQEKPWHKIEHLVSVSGIQIKHSSSTALIHQVQGQSVYCYSADEVVVSI